MRTLQVILLLLATGTAEAQEATKHFDPCLEIGVRKSVVFLGQLHSDGTGSIEGTGFLTIVDDVFYLVTAKHVVWDTTAKKLLDADMVALFNDRSGRVSTRSLALVKKQSGVEWAFHPDERVDVAVLPFRLNLTLDDVKVIPLSMFESSTGLSELQDVFFLSYQPGLEIPGKVVPIARRGMISLFNADGTFFVDAFIFPGNSGSPVFVKPSAMSFARDSIVTGDPQGCKFIGVAGGYLPYVDIAVSLQTKRERVRFEENSGLAKVWPVEFLKAIFETEAFKTQHARVKVGPPN